MWFSISSFFEPALIDFRAEKKLPVLSFSRSAAIRRAPALSGWPRLQEKKKALADARSTAVADDLWVCLASDCSTFSGRVGVIASMPDFGLRSLFGAAGFSGVKPPLISRLLRVVPPANQPLERNAYVCHASCGARVAPATVVADL